MLRKNISYYFLLLVLLTPLFTYAAPLLPECDPLPGAAKVNNSPDCTVDSLFELLVNIYNFLLGLAGLVLLLMLIWGGIRMLTFYISESPDIAEAKHTISRAITGFVIIAMAYLIVNTLLTLLGFDKTSAIGVLLGKYF